MAGIPIENKLSATKRFKKIPIYVVEEHNDALQFIYNAIGGKKLPLEGTTLLHLDAHPDMLIDRKLKGDDARSGREVLPLLQIENWIVPAAAAGHIDRVIWLRPPWAKQFTDGTRNICVGDHPSSGLLRVDSTEPYYLSDALYSAQLVNKRQFTLTVEELYVESKPEHYEELAHKLNIAQPFVLDIDLDFFSTGNPFLGLYDNIKLYDRLLPIFDFKFPMDNDLKTIEEAVQKRETQLQELESLFTYLDEHKNLDEYETKGSELFCQVSELIDEITVESNRCGDTPDWWAIFAAGCTRDQDGLPYHISTEEEIKDMVTKALLPLLENIPKPVLITISRSTDDGYCPFEQVEYIQSLVLETLKKVYDTNVPLLYYLNGKSV